MYCRRHLATLAVLCFLWAGGAAGYRGGAAAAAEPGAAAATPAAPAHYAVGDKVQMLLGRTWSDVTVTKVDGDRYSVHYEGNIRYYDWDKTVGPDALRLTPVIKPIVRAPVRPGETTFDGLYLQVNTSMGGGRLSFSLAHYWFRPDGHAYFGVPPGGLEKAADFAVLEKLDPKNCGVYTVAGDKLTIQRTGEEANTYAYTTEGERAAVIHFSGPALVRVGRFAAHAALDGNYEGGSSAAGGGVFIAASSHFNLHPDGSFESGSVVGFDSAGEKVSVGGGAVGAPAKGKYDLSGNTISLAYADGKSVSFTAYPYPDKAESPPARLSINGQMFKKSTPK
jgi:hypothetical protein